MSHERASCLLSPKHSLIKCMSLSTHGIPQEWERSCKNICLWPPKTFLHRDISCLGFFSAPTLYRWLLTNRSKISRFQDRKGEQAALHGRKATIFFSDADKAIFLSLLDGNLPSPLPPLAPLNLH